MKCIKCGVTVSRKKESYKNSDFICKDCKMHEKVITSIYEEAKHAFADNTKQIEKTDVFELLKNVYFIVQRNPKLSVYSTIVKELLEEFAVRGGTEMDYDELWRRTKSSRNILKILKSMEDAEIIKIESPDKIRRILKPSPLLKKFIDDAYKPYRTQEQTKIRLASTLTMYIILHEMYVLANTKSQEEIIQRFGPHTPKAPWVATMFLWTERVKEGLTKEFNEEEIRKYFTKRNLSATTISNYIAALKATSPHSLQQYIENIQPSGDNNVKFIIREELVRSLERIYSERVREVDRA